MKRKILKLKGANMDIDLTSEGDVSWKQDKCPWNKKEKTSIHKCAVKNISICDHFTGIEDPDIVLCRYSKK